MADKEARIRIGIENASQTIADITKISGAFKGILPALEGVIKLAKATSLAIAEIKPLKPVEATNAAASYRDQVTRLSIAMTGSAKNVDALSAKFAEIGERIKINATDVAALAAEYGQMSYDFKGAASSIEDLGRLSNNTGRPLHDLMEIGADLHKRLGVPMKEVTGTIIRFGEIARNVGTTGGRNAFLDTIHSLGGAMEKFSVNTDKGRERLAAFIALTGKGLGPSQATEAASESLGWISGNALGLGRYLGRKTLIHGGKIDDPVEILQAIRQKIGRSRDRAAALRVLANYTSPAAAENLAHLSEFTTQDALFGATEAATGRKYGLPGVGAIDLGEAPAKPAIPGAMILSAPAPRIRMMTDEEQQKYEEKYHLYGGDTYAASKAGRLAGAGIEKENVQLRVGGKLLEARDVFEQGYEGRREEQLADDTMIDMLGIKGTIINGVRSAAAADEAGRGGDSVVSGAPARAARTEKLQEQVVEQLKEVNRSLRHRDHNSHSVDSRKRAVQ